MKDRPLNNKPELKSYRTKLRNKGTAAEAYLWGFLKNKQLAGKKFRRQFSVGNYILDFYCPSGKLCVELDGAGHFIVAGYVYDQKRTAFFKYPRYNSN